MRRIRSIGTAIGVLAAAVGVAVSGPPLVAEAATTCNATSFPSFGTADDARLQRNGKAAYTESGRLRLTPSEGGVGSAFTKSTISLANDASFSTAFSFQFTGQTGGGADGIVFVVQTVSNNVGGGGGGIGYDGIPKSVGVEFDNWYNDTANDVSSSHVGIDLNGSVISAVQADTQPDDLDDGHVRYAWVDYNGATDLLEVRLATTADRPTSAFLSSTVDLTTVLGATDAFLGFTSGTGAATANHDVIDWTFTNCYAPLGQSEPPTVDAGPAVSGAPGGAIAVDGTVTDPDVEETVTTTWTASDPACTFAAPSSVDTSVTCTKAGTFTLTLTASDGVNPAVTDTTTATVTAPVVKVEEDPTKLPLGYRMVAVDGGVFTFGKRGFHGSLGDRPLNKPIVGGADDPRRFEGYWLVASDGGVFTFGEAGFFGSLGDQPPTVPVVEIEPTVTGNGYWLVDASGKVYPFGDAKHFGDRTGQPLNAPIIGMVATPTGRGYYLVGQDGGVFSYGDAVFLGSMGATPLNAPIDDLEPTPDGKGYYLVARDGGVFSFGAPFFGSTGSMTLNGPVIAMLVSPDGKGYWLAARDGGIFTFGDLPFYGSMGSVPLTAPVDDLIH